MTGTTFDPTIIDNMADSLARAISLQWLNWDMARNDWKREKMELRNYVFATDTRKTTNAQLPWKNSTTMPKLCQIRDNLHANYMAALFPHSDWLIWEPGDKDAATVAKRDAVLAYMKNKLYLSKYRSIVSDLVLDYVDYGNAFVTCEWAQEYKVDPVSGERIPGYIGPRAIRINPMDIVFNPIAAKFEDSPKIVRSYKSFGEIKRMLNKAVTENEREMLQRAYDKGLELRRRAISVRPEDMPINDRLNIDGFGSYWQYLQSGTVEFLTFYGDLYDSTTGEFYEDHKIVIIDRMWVIQKETIPGWLARSVIRHCGWRSRQDNLWAMGPLDNLVGMQYRIDHLENLKADVFDMIAFPMPMIKGYVHDFEYAPGEKIVCGDEGNVEFLHPDTTALNADNQIQVLEDRMEEMAGAPKQAMGFRTPGEKTAYEVQTLENAAGRIFQNKASYFEENLIEPNINDQLALARMYMDEAEVIKVLNDEYSVSMFQSITKEDITATGKIQPHGASEYIRRNILLQNLNNFLNSSYAQNNAVQANISALASAKAFSELLGLNNYNIVQKNIRLYELADMDATQRELQNQLAQEGMTNPADGSTNPNSGSPEQLLGLVEQAQGNNQGGGTPGEGTPQ